MTERKAQPARVVLKALWWPEAYEREKNVYERLQHAEVTNVLGFNVPKLIAFDDQALVPEMTIVERPFVLDFAGAYLDARPEFQEEVWREWESEKREQFEERWPVVERILEAFEGLGIYLLDVLPATSDSSYKQAAGFWNAPECFHIVFCDKTRKSYFVNRKLMV